MKTTKYTYTIISIFIGLAFATQSYALTLNPIADSDVYHYYGSVDSTPETLGVSYAAFGESDHSQTSAIKFDLSGVSPGSFATATLRLNALPFTPGFASFSTGAGMNIGMSANEWVSSGLTTATADDAVVMGAPLQVFSESGWVNYDITSIVNAQASNPFANNGLILSALPGASYQFASSETDFAPQLVLAAIPEPSTYALILGLCSLGFLALKRKK
tara:strand:- start:423 stop:1073 length:651 start_codon:yes stop_codon:yes gene_type:complete